MKTRVKNDIFWSDIGSGFGGTGQHTPTKNSQEYPPKIHVYTCTGLVFVVSVLSFFLTHIFGIETVKTFVHSPSSLIKTIPDSRPKQSLPAFSDQYSAKPYPLGRYILILLMSPPDIYI